MISMPTIPRPHEDCPQDVHDAYSQLRGGFDELEADDLQHEAKGQRISRLQVDNPDDFAELNEFLASGGEARMFQERFELKHREIDLRKQIAPFLGKRQRAHQALQSNARNEARARKEEEQKKLMALGYPQGKAELMAAEHPAVKELFMKVSRYDIGGNFTSQRIEIERLTRELEELRRKVIAGATGNAITPTVAPRMSGFHAEPVQPKLDQKPRYPEPAVYGSRHARSRGDEPGAISVR